MRLRPPAPTALGVKTLLFFLLLLAAFLATPYSNLFFLLLLFLSVLAVAAWWGARRNLAGVTARLEPCEPAPAGAGTPLHALVDAGPRPRFGLAVELMLEGAGTVTLPCCVAAGPAALAGRVPPLPRGIHPVRAARLVSSWPLGLFRVRLELDPPPPVVVYPAPSGGQLDPHGAGGLDELCALATAARAGMLQPSELREYRRGDDLRRVHWKASARRNTLVLTEWEGGGGQGREVVLDRRCPAPLLEESLSLLSALVQTSRELKEPLTLHTQGLSETFGTGRRAWRELLEFLAGAATLPPDAAAPPPASPEVPRLPLREGGAR